MKNIFLKIFVAVSYVLMIAVNALANILPINGNNTGVVSNAYPNLFAPAAVTFSIWGLIYALLAAYTIYQFGLFQKLNPKQQTEAENAINSLIEKGYIVYEDEKSGPKCIRLTDIGFNQLYKNSKSIADIENLIMREFEKQHSKAGHILMIKNLNFGLLQTFNPIEKDLFEPAVNNLISKELITYENGSPECLRLNEKGYATLYL